MKARGISSTTPSTGEDDLDIDGDVGYTITTAAAASADLAYDTLDAADVSVTNLDNDGVVVEIAVTDIDPNFAEPNQQKLVAITGSDFVNGTTANFGTKVNVLSVTFVSSTQLDVLIKVHKKASTGPRDVTVTNPDNSSATVADGFTVTSGLLADTTSDVPTIPIQVTVADLPGNQLGSTVGNTITLDTNAAGIGWFIGATTGDTAFDQYDLLTAAAHEVGHALGYQQSHNGVMADTLSIGERRLPVIAEDIADPPFLHPVQNSDTDVSNDDVPPILQQPVYAETEDHALNGDVAEHDMAVSSDDTPLAILPDGEFDGMFTNLNGSLLDELRAV